MWDTSAQALVKTRYFYAEGGESLRHLLENTVGLSRELLDTKGYFNKIKLWNPSIENITSLGHRERVYVEVPYRITFVRKKVDNTPEREVASLAPDKQQQSAQTSLNGINSQKLNPLEKKTWHYSLSYAISRGSFEEIIFNSDITTESSQDSPLTVGFSAARELSPYLNVRGGFYLSKLDSVVFGNQVQITIPWEYGLSSYFEYKNKKISFTPYAGIDHDRFSSFNTDELPRGEPLSIRRHSLTYLTIGAVKAFKWFDRKFLTKVSYGQSIISSQSRESLTDPEEYSGSKFVLYVEMKADKNWYYHSFYKQYDLTGANQLHISRLGVGLGYSF